MLVNGIPQTTVEISDRAVAYGDGVFETIRLHRGSALFLAQHLERLQAGCERLGIEYQQELLKQDITQLAEQFNRYEVLKIIVSRGSTGRGYRPAINTRSNTDLADGNQSTRILSLHSLPNYSQAISMGGIKAFLCKQRLGFQPSLAGIKHLNRLEQVLASREWPGEEFLEGIMLDLDNNVIEGTKSNIFFAEGNCLFTPSLTQCGVAGIMRKMLLAHFGDRLKVEACSLARLIKADEVFVANSVFGIWPLLSLDMKSLNIPGLTIDKGEIQYAPAGFSEQAQQVFTDALLKCSQDE